MSTTHFATRLAEPLAVCGVRFTHADYSASGDLLYLTRGVPLGFGDGETEEGHAVFAGDDGRITGVLVQCPRAWVDEEGALSITLRAGGPTTRLSGEQVEALLREATCA